MPTWLVTGGSGFFGRHLLRRLEFESVDIVCLGRTPIPGARWIGVDLLDPLGLKSALESIRPDLVFHLAGKTPPADTAALDASNRVASINLLEGLAGIGRPTRIVLTGSAAELGPVPVEALPVDEDHHARPLDPYGQSKLAATEAALGCRSPIEPIIARVFNPIGPGQPESQAFGRFARTLAQGSGPITLAVGDLSPRRDFVDVRDVAHALVALATTADRGLYHIGTGVSRSIAEGLDLLVQLSGREVRVEVDLTRPGGPADSRAEIGKLQAATGWSPRIGFEESLADLWRSTVEGRD